MGYSFFYRFSLFRLKEPENLAKRYREGLDPQQVLLDGFLVLTLVEDDNIYSDCKSSNLVNPQVFSYPRYDVHRTG
jgi:hypothetical protein